MAKKIGSNTKQFVDIADVRGSLVLLKDGSLRSIISVESVNFDLKSPDEQTAILQGFQSLVNALDFPLQIVVTSRTLDLSNYLELLEVTQTKLTNELLKTQLTEYAKFIQDLTKLANVMEKKFYVVVPYHAIEAVKNNTGFLGKLKDLFSATRHAAALTEENEKQYGKQVEQRVAVVLSGLSPLGVKTKLLEHDELLQIFQRLYNPGQVLPT
ncbi:MAG: hypothetical protein AAB483_01785 [Patescibacteria group bacterium]